MIVTVMEAGSGPGDYARVRLSNEPDGVNPPDVFEFGVSLKARPSDVPRGYEVWVLAGTATEFAELDDPQDDEGPTLALMTRVVDMP